MKRLLILTLALAFLLTACSGPIQLTSPSQSGYTQSTQTDSQPGRASDYASLIRLIRKMQGNSSSYPIKYMMRDAAGAPTNAETQATSGKSDYSQTNIQVEGVDEADIIKTDGSYLYLVANNRLYIVDARDPANMRVLAQRIFRQNQETETISSGESPMEMFLDLENNRLVLIVSGWINEKIPQPTEPVPTETKPSETPPPETQPGETTPSETAPDETSPASSETGETTQPEETTGSGGGSLEQGVAVSQDLMPSSRIWYPYYNQKQYTTTRIYDLSDKSDPRLVRQFTQTGYYVTSRKIGSAVYVVTNQYQYRLYYSGDSSDPKPADVFPATCDNEGDVTLENWDVLPPESITILPQGDAGSQMVLSALDIADDQSKPDLLAVLGYSGTVYASASYLYVAGVKYQWDGRKGSQPVYSTDIFRYKLAGARISEAGKGSVPGNILNQFSLDEWNGHLRIATTTYEWTTQKDSNMVNANKNHVFVLDPSMKTVGKVVDLAPGESIKSVRFMGDKAYVVTFRDIDPLFVIDLAVPAAPRVLGQLKIPGYSTYLHPYETDKLLGFGFDVRSEGGNAYNMGLKVSLFDISDFSNPREMSTILLGGRGSYADILYNHKTLLFSEEKNLIAFPATLTKMITQNPLEYGQPVFQGLLLLEVDAAYQVRLRGSVTHFDKLSDPNGEAKPLTEKDSAAFYGYDAVFRSAYIGDTLFTISGRQVRASSLASLAKLGSVELDGYNDGMQVYYNGPVAVRAAD